MNTMDVRKLKNQENDSFAGIRKMKDFSENGYVE